MNGIEQSVQRSYDQTVDLLVHYHGWDKVAAAFTEYAHYRPRNHAEKLRRSSILLLSYIPWWHWPVYPRTLAESVHILIANFGCGRINNYQSIYVTENT